MERQDILQEIHALKSSTSRGAITPITVGTILDHIVGNYSDADDELRTLIANIDVDIDTITDEEIYALTGGSPGTPVFLPSISQQELEDILI